MPTHACTCRHPVGQELKASSDVLLADASTLGTTGVHHGDKLHMHVVEQVEPPTTVEVSLPPSMHAAFGPLMRVAASDSHTVREVRSRIYRISGVPEGMQTIELGGRVLGDEVTLGEAGVAEQGGKLSLRLSGPPPPPPMLITVAPSFIDAETRTQQLLALPSNPNELEAVKLKHVIRKYANVLALSEREALASLDKMLVPLHSPAAPPAAPPAAALASGPAVAPPSGLSHRAQQRLATIEQADTAMRKGIEKLLARNFSHASDILEILKANQAAGSPSVTARLNALLANVEAADNALHAAVHADPLSVAGLLAAFERYGFDASPRLRRKVRMLRASMQACKGSACMQAHR